MVLSKPLARNLWEERPGWVGVTPGSAGGWELFCLQAGETFLSGERIEIFGWTFKERKALVEIQAALAWLGFQWEKKEKKP